MDKFLSCDWGSSVFRLRLANLETAEVIAAETTGDGIIKTFNSWKEAGDTDPESRFAFFMNIISQQVRALENILTASLSGVPLVISGMASSSIGMKTLPYRELPLELDGSNLMVDYSEQGDGPVLLISGLKTDKDVIRGEETQLIGCFDDGGFTGGEQLYIFPGTHSKHILIKDEQAIGFRTYMTGEFFDLLSQHSILSATIETDKELHTSSFHQGVQDAIGTNLLHACFSVRTNGLFDKLSKTENYHYLSGLLIGSELQELGDTKYDRVCLCSGAGLKTHYETALHLLGLSSRLVVFDGPAMDEAVIRGQRKILLNKLKHE